MTPYEQFRRIIRDLNLDAQRDLQAIWRSVGGDPAALAEILAELVQTYGEAAAALSADWYDELRADTGVRAGFTAVVPEPREPGTRVLLEWAAAQAASEDSFRSLVSGGIQRRITNYSRDVITTSAVRDPRARGWMRTGRGECGFCAMLVSRGAVYSKATVDFASHDHCFPGDVMVTGPSVEVGYRRWYEGELVVIRTAGGDDLPVTPNHPVLTRRGWIAAGEIRVGDELFQRSGADLATLDVPHERDVPSRIEDVWRSNAMNRLRTVPVSAEDFHGDIGIRESDVDVVATDRLLSDVRDRSLVQELAESVGAGAGPTAVLDALATLGDGLLPFVCPAHGPDGGVRGGGVGASFLFGHSGGANKGRVSRGSDRQPSVLIPPSHDVAGNTESFRYSEDAISGGMNLNQVSGRVDPIVPAVRPGGPSLHAGASEGLADSVTGLSSECASDLVERLSGGVEPLCVIDLVRSDFRGHVYNLQTAEGWYSANGFIVHNCKCGAAPAWSPNQVKAVKDEFVPSARRRADETKAADAARARAWIAANL